MVIAFDEKAEIVQPFTADALALKTAIDSITPTDRKSRLKLAYQLADAQLAFIAEQLRPGSGVVLPDVFVYSDGRVLDASELSIKGNLTYEKIGTTERRQHRGRLRSAPSATTSGRPRCRSSRGWRTSDPKVEKADVELSVSPIDPADSGEGRLQGARHCRPSRCCPSAGRTRSARRPSRRARIGARQRRVHARPDDRRRHPRRAQEQGRATRWPPTTRPRSSLPPPRALSVLLVTDGNYYLERADRTA